MAIYIKANHLVAKALKVEDVRIETQDGCFILWQADMLRFGTLFQLPEIIERIGAIALTPTEAREEQDGIKLRKLPLATEEQFQYDNPYPYEPEYPTVPDDDASEEASEGDDAEPAEPLPDMSAADAVVIEDVTTEVVAEPTEEPSNIEEV